ncbi:hypothetical protein EDD18DRAFT_868753 [Armillaria luteobubalina]|uniref:Uncharacterized protein n=1 Tax=Armillaria luteobubalina TaxID=153913 RepID=A0AA39P7M5_9AGAR|nr:hypothetical protein EDD18DRAFT_868753 [Armillaria luteobubalina]
MFAACQTYLRLYIYRVAMGLDVISCYLLSLMIQSAIFDSRSSSATRRSKSVSFQTTSYSSPARAQKPRSFLSALKFLRRKVISSLLSHPTPPRAPIPLPTPSHEPRIESEVIVISRPVNLHVKLVPRKVHYETVRRRQHGEEPALHTFHPVVAPIRRSKRPSTAPQLQGSGKRFDGFVRRREKKQAWSGEWNRTDIRDVIKDLRSLR